MTLIVDKAQFILAKDHSLFRHCHASTLVRSPQTGGLLVAFFAGDKEGSGNTAIWLAEKHSDGWQAARRVVAKPGVAHWNPVLHVDRPQNCLWLFYKTGPDVHHWVTEYVTSGDGGLTWSDPRPLAVGDRLPRGPVKNKLLVMSNGEWLAPASIEGQQWWDAFVDLSCDGGHQWQRYAIPLVHHQGQPSEQALWQGLADNALWETDLNTIFQWDGVIQPTLWESQPGHIHALMRSSRHVIYRSDSTDYGRTWCSAYPTTLPNNNSGIDAVKVADDLLVLVYNPVFGNWGKRSPISVAFSTDNGASWSTPHDLLDGEGEFSYPAIIADQDTLHITYTWNRKNIIYQQVMVKK